MAASRRDEPPRFQTGFSTTAPVMLRGEDRAIKVRKMLAVLAAAGALPQPPRGVAVDIGCSGGFFTQALAPHFGCVVGSDIDQAALSFATREAAAAATSYVLADSLRLPLRDATVDLVICNHVYEHVPDARGLFAEIMRILRPGGKCFLGAASSLTILEPHYRLPFLSWLPKPLAHRYMRAAGKGDYYYENLRTYWGIKALTRGFVRHDFTLRVIREPDRFHARDLIPAGSLIEKMPVWLWRALFWLLPSYIFILEKPAAAAARD